MEVEHVNAASDGHPRASHDAPALSPEDGKAFMDVIAYGERAGWDGTGTPARKANGTSAGSDPTPVGHKRLLLNVVAARRFHQNDNETNDGGAVPTAADGGAVAVAAAPAAAGSANADGERKEEVQAVLIEAKKIYTAADAALSNGLTSCEDWMKLRDDFYHSGALFAVAGLPDDAARCLLQATFINRAFRDDEEALSSLTLAVQNIKLAHPGVATDSLLRLAKCYERSGLLFQAARCLKEAAEIFDGRLDEKRSAVRAYTAAIAMYERTNNPFKVHRTLVDACRERLCYLHTALEQYETAEAMFLEKANHTPKNLPATRFYLYATLAVLARGHDSEEAYFDSIYDTKKVFDRLQERDREFQKGKENELMRAILTALEENSLNQFDLAVTRYKEYSATIPSDTFDLVVERCRQNLFDHLERFA